jgi:uncharacterized lipoprotein YddW (UPF0748 family)
MLDRDWNRAWVVILALLIPGIPSTDAQELRGLWVDAFHAGLRTSTEARQVIADARTGGFNSVFVQVRKRGDAYFRGGIEPVASDVAAGFDPLAELIREAHDTQGGKPRIQVHAWVVAYNIWNQRLGLPQQGSHPFRLHADWLTRDRSGETWDGSNYAFDPGHPEVQEYTHGVVMDLIRRYDVDGLHWDYIRYNGPEWGYHPESVTRFNRLHGRTGQPLQDDAAWLQFRRDQVTALVRRTYLSAHQLKPDLIVSAATIAWAPGIQAASQWPQSAPNRQALQDWRSWMEEGILDLNVPMLYFRQNERAADWSAWSLFAKDHRYRRGVALGVGAYLNTLSNGLAQARTTRRPTARSAPADGVVFYSRAVPATDSNTAGFLRALTQSTQFDTNPIPMFAEASQPWSAPWKRDSSRGHLTGRLLEADGRVNDGGWIRVRRMDGDGEGRMLRSDANGWFGAIDLPRGEWLVNAGSDVLANALLTRVQVVGGRTETAALLRGWEDPDGDGALNWEEVIAGTDPLLGDSRLRLRIARTEGGVRLQVDPWSAGRIYRLWHQEGMTDPDWRMFGSPLTGPVTTIESGGEMGLFRLSVDLD